MSVLTVSPTDQCPASRRIQGMPRMLAAFITRFPRLGAINHPSRAIPKLPISASRPLAVLIIDASYSMAKADWKPSRLAAAKEAAIAYAKQAYAEHPNVLLAIVAYGDQATLIAPPTPASRIGLIQTCIQKIDCMGCTNIYAGLIMAEQIATNSYGPIHIVLLSDGRNTDDDPRPVAERLKHRARIDTVGIGRQESVDENLLKAIATTDANGPTRYRWIGQKQQLVEHFHHLAGGIRRA